jgi:hypothetical protein
MMTTIKICVRFIMIINTSLSIVVVCCATFGSRLY